jgi:hypothetical protein
MGSGCNGRAAVVEPATPVARCMPLPEALVFSISSSLVLSRDVRLRLLCPETYGSDHVLGGRAGIWESNRYR